MFEIIEPFKQSGVKTHAHELSPCYLFCNFLYSYAKIYTYIHVTHRYHLIYFIVSDHTCCINSVHSLIHLNADIIFYSLQQKLVFSWPPQSYQYPTVKINWNRSLAVKKIIIIIITTSWLLQNLTWVTAIGTPNPARQLITLLPPPLTTCPNVRLFLYGDFHLFYITLI